MKIKNFKWSCFAIIAVATMPSCSEDVLDVDPQGSIIESDYYQNEGEAYSGLISVYDMLRKHSGGFENTMAMLNAGSDDFFAGGGNATDGAGIQSFSNYSISPSTLPSSFWNDFYQGIFKANTLLTKLPDVPMDETVKARFAAEAMALRAYYYFELITQFKSIPLITAPLTTEQYYSTTQAERSAVYAQIESDLLAAINNLPGTITISNEGGRFTKGAAQGLLGKVYLYQHKNSEAAAILAEVNGTPGATNQYGNHLLTNFADLWDLNNKYNAESLLESAHTSAGNTTWDNWGWGSDEGNTFSLMLGPRGYNAISPTAPHYLSGWSFNTATLDLVNDMQGDPRFNETILDMTALVTSGQATYTPANNDTGYFLKKFMPTTSDIIPGGGVQDLNYAQNTYIIRLADTYLLEAEALGGSGPRAQALLDAVRARVGLPSVPVSLPAIAHERRMELAGEGHRWRDLVRTGQAASELASRGFIAGKHEFWPIPLRETENTLIVQDPAYN